ncbi:hypothetical protein MNV49_005244 [Pseudohyphozyma bogoriensis]|nr:hypothetical protein MNV49_005244 [Pseudohyphozyma bogoriensis]
MANSSDKKGLGTRSIHADAQTPTKGREVAPYISVTTTFLHPDPDDPSKDLEFDPANPDRDVYSRYSQPTLTRTERVLSSIIGAPTVMYPSGIAAAFAILLLYRPDVIAITDGYHGCHASIEVYRKVRGEDAVKVIDLDDPYPTKGTFLCWLESPLNPTGESKSIEAYSKKAHAVGGKLAIDSTFAPPPLQDPFLWGADAVFHSGTKYFAGHSDALSGTVSVKEKSEWMQLWHNRTYTGSSPGSLESWLVLRSLRTLGIRVARQSATATALAQWLSSLTRAAPGTDLDGPAGVVKKVWHTSLQQGESFIGEGKQMTAGPPCFAILLEKKSYAERLPHVVKYFMAATSLGGVESLMEQRVVSDSGADPCLIRISVGMEDFEDLKADLIYGFRKVVQLDNGNKL